jgi:hypothetical protein
MSLTSRILTSPDFTDGLILGEVRRFQERIANMAKVKT